MSATAFKQVADNAVSTTATSLASTGVTSITLATGDGAKFPAPGNGFWVTIWVGTSGSDPASDANMEKVLCSARSGDVLTIGATTKTHTGGTVNVGLLDVAANTSDMQTAINNIETGAKTLDAVTSAGNIKANTGHSLDLQNAAGNSDAFLYNNGGSGASIVQTDAPMHVTAPDNTTHSVVTTTDPQTLTGKTLGGALSYNRTTKADVSYTLLASDYLVVLTSITAARTFTLPTAVGVAGQTYIIKDESGSVTSTNTLTIATTSSQTIDGKTSVVLNRPYDTLQVESDGSNWKLIEIPQSLTAGSAVVDNEVPGGSVNSSNTVFTTASQFATNSLNVYRNGVRQKGGGVDYTVNGTSNGFTMTSAPATGDLLLCDYNVWSSVYSVGTNSNITGETPAGLVNASNTVYTTARAYIAGTLEVFVDGVRQKGGGSDFTETTPSTGTLTFGVAPANGSVIQVNYQFNLNPSSNSDTVDGMHGSEVAPIGVIQMFAAAVAPSGWLICDGSSLLRTSYQALFNVIGTTFGSVDGTHFTLPDMRGRTPLGVGTATGAAGATAHTLGQVGGEETHTMTSGELVAHTHNTAPSGSDGNVVAGGSGGNANAGITLTGSGYMVYTNHQGGSTGSSTPFNELPPYVGLNYIIKSQ